MTEDERDRQTRQWVDGINKQFREIIINYGVANAARAVGCHRSWIMKSFAPGRTPSLSWLSLVAYSLGYELNISVVDRKTGKKMMDHTA